jgi:multiple sugar transport system permease protein
MASTVLAALPLVLVFLLVQRQIVEGVAGTGLK